MSRTLDLYAPEFPHGTVDGYRAGCHGSQCGAAIACRDVYRRYQGDFSFRKRIDAGMTPAEIAAADDAEREAAAQRDRDAARAQRLAEREASRPKKAPKPPSEPRPSVLEKLGPEIRRMHAEGMIDREIGAVVGLTHSSISRLRRGLGLPRVQREPVSRVERAHTPRANRREDVARLHERGLRDEEIADELGMKTSSVGNLRRDLGLAPHRKPRAPRERVYRPRRDRRPEVAAAHAEGLNDREISERVGLSKSEAARLRRDLGLPPNDGPRKPSTRKLQPHGTNACHARGCRRLECVEASRVYYREYARTRRAEGIPAEHHGTPYGYQLGCRGRKACTAETSCTDAMLAEERRRRREAGTPEQPARVPAEPVRQHVRALLDRGRSVLWIAGEAQVSVSGLKTLLYGRSGDRKGEFPAHIEATKAERLLAVGRAT